MFRLIPRRLLRPTTLALLAIAAAWGGWWLWNERALSVLQMPGLGKDPFIQISPDGRCIHSVSYEWSNFKVGSDPPKPITALRRLPSGEDVIPKNHDHDRAVFLNDNRVLLLKHKESACLVDLSKGKIVWEVQENFSFRDWSRDGRIFVAKTDEPESPVVLFDTNSGNRLVLPNAATPFVVDASGRYVVSLLSDDPAAFAVWDAADGRELKRLRSPGNERIVSIELHPDGSQAATFVEKDKDLQDHSLQLWDLWSDQAAPCKSLRITRDSDLLFDNVERQYRSPELSLLWDIAKNRTEWEIQVPWGRFDCSGKCYLREGAVAEHWVLCDAENHAEIASGERYPSPIIFACDRYDLQIAPAGQWFVNHRQRDLTEFDHLCVGYLGRPLKPKEWYEIISLADGHVIKRINTADSIVGPTIENRIWTYRSAQVGDSDEWTTTLGEWSAEPSRPPWWLWSLTAAGVLFAIWLVRRAPLARRG